MKKISLFVFLFASCALMAQDTMPLDLSTALSIGGASNLTIKEYQQRQALALADHAKAREWWLPDLYLGTAVHQRWGTAMNADGHFFTDVDRQFFWAGLGLNMSWDFGEGVYNAKGANYKEQAAQYRTQAEKNQALLEVIEAYYDLLLAQLEYRSFEALAFEADTLAMQMEIQVDAGLTYSSDLLLARSNSDHLRIEMLNSRADYIARAAKIRALLDLEPGKKLVCVDTVLSPMAIVEDDLQPVFDTIYELRPEMTALNLDLMGLEAERKSTTTGLLLPELRLGAWTSQFGDVFSPTQPTTEVNASLLWHLPLGRAVYAGELKRYDAEIAITRTQLDQQKVAIDQEVVQAKENIAVAEEQIDIAKRGADFAASALAQCRQRQLDGTSRPFEVIQAQEIFLKIRIDHLRAVAAFNKEQYKLFVAMGNNL